MLLGFSLPVLGVRTVWCSAADTHLNLLGRGVSGACFFNRGMCFIVSLHIIYLWQYYVCCIRWCNPMHPLYGALPVPYVLVRVSRGALVAHRYNMPLLAADHRSKNVKDCRTFIPLSVSLWNDLAENFFDSVGLTGFKSMINQFFSSTIFLLFFFFQWVGIVRLGSRTDRV